MTSSTSRAEWERDTIKTPPSMYAPRVCELGMDLDVSPTTPTMVHGWKELHESAPGVTITEPTPKPFKLDMDIDTA